VVLDWKCAKTLWVGVKEWFRHFFFFTNTRVYFLMVKLYVKTSGGRTVLIEEAGANETIEAIKQRVFEKELVRVGKLSFNGAQLDDDKTLGYYAIDKSPGFIMLYS
jgi:hypothetical protein